MQPGYVFFLAGTLAVLTAYAQTPAAPAARLKGQGASADVALTFTVASVKPLVQVPGGGRSGGIAMPLNEPGRLRFPAATLKSLAMFAWNVKDFQIVGPGWIGDERFTIDATMPPDTTADQTRAMLRNLLADRFKVEVRRETRPLSIYSMVIAKNGLKMPNTPPPHAKELGNSGFATDGFPFVPPEVTGVTVFIINGQMRITAQQATMHELAVQLERLLDRPVTDETKLTAKFNFILNCSPEGLTGPGGRPLPALPRDAATGLEAGEPLRDVFSALQSEIGIKLEPKRGPLEMIVIDHAEKVPTAN
jgi:uncharacterized protein (TIGR03435 family)